MFFQRWIFLRGLPAHTTMSGFFRLLIDISWS